MAESSNCIMTGAIVEAMYYAMLNRGAVDASCFPISNFGEMFLTDYNGIEDMNNFDGLKGNIIGFANAKQPFASVNPLQGNYDPVYSIVDFKNKLIRFSFNFGADKANGTFQTLWWSGSREIETDTGNSPNGLGYGLKVVELFDMTSLPNGVPVTCNSKGDIFFIDTNTIYRYRLYLNGSKKTLVLQDTKVKEVYAPADACFNPITKAFWVVKGNTAFIDRYDENFNKIDTIAKDSRMTYLTTGISRFAFYKMSMYAVQTLTANGIYKFDWQGVFVKQYTNILNTSMRTHKGIYADDKYLYVSYADAYSVCYTDVFKEDAVTGDLVLVCRNQTSLTIDKFGYRAFMYNKMLNGYFITNKGHFVKSFNQIGAQSKLASPITKVPGQTMKLNYRFQFK